MATYRVLAIDGGGIRGLLPVLLLQRLSAVTGLRDFLDSVDLIAGTSTGGLIALTLACNIGLDKIRDLFIQKGPEIFDDSWMDDLADLGRLRGAEYKTEPLRRELRRLCGLTSLRQLAKHVLITSFDLDNGDSTLRVWKPKLFHNLPGKESDGELSVVQVGLYTSAAPTFFPSVDGYIDGGVYASNPAMCALAQTQDRRYEPVHPLNEVILLSLGTGINLQFIRGVNLDWGYAQWIRPLVGLILDATSGVADYQCRQMLGEHYHRLDPFFPQGVTIRLDEVKKIPFLLEFAEKVELEPAIAWLQHFWMPR